MLFHTVILFSLIYSAFSSISCYDCSLKPDTYNYIITADTIPSEIRNCQIKADQTGCRIDVRWYLTTNMTGINFLVYNTLSMPLEHTLRVKTFISGIGVIQQIEHSFYYFCTTDRCNDPYVFKQNLFDGRGCLFYTNKTDKSCNTTSDIDPKICKQCSTTFTTETILDTICATCFSDDIYGEQLGEEVVFNMTDRTRISSSFIHCQSQGCNGLNIGHQIRDKSRIAFDFNKFLSYNTSSKQIASSSLITTAMIIIAFIIKTFY
ncbi:unnamed protein product [Rotaria sp. Silwood2]|nr:unnamed protein product [Rotaria sp. Silwood2]CAF2762812.1 unnamed protein product [Rotaria sp. Silwood2]CAF3026740.1 unnamed protein product [Rotaria sp. Silwood2]CAF3217636.1 unnamed protein product [Rotaria sp. Silwood2]CAF4035474.1 unnamed protein product [Rotaria sp. Silwood2]